MVLERLAYRRIPNAQVQAFDWPILGPLPRGFRGGPVLTEEVDAPLWHVRRGRPVDSFRPDEGYEDRLAGQYVYAGPIVDHFGHYMAECVHRIVTARIRGLRFPPLFVSSHGFDPYPTYHAFPDFMKETLAFLGIRPSEAVVINRNTIVEVLHITEPGSELAGAPKPGYADALTEFSTPKLDERHGTTRRPRKLYVSRSALRPQGMLLGEAWFEEQLERDGFTIFRPEEWRISPQLDHYRKAEIVVFPEGSACHGTELLGTGMMGRCFLLPRRSRQEARKFERIVAPRSREFSLLSSCTEYLGTAAVDRQTREPHRHLGATWLDLGGTIAAFRRAQMGTLQSASLQDYRAAAETDLQRYLEFQARPGGRFDEAGARALTEAFARRMAEA